MEKSLVSVLIPAYNHEKYVKETIKSIIAQTYKNIELIIVDDGSKDSTWQKIEEMRDKCEERFVRVHFETKENEGTCRTLNKLLSIAQGEFVYLIASDDLAKPQAIEKEVSFLENNPDYVLVVGDSEIIDQEGRICYWDKKKNNIYDKKRAKYFTLVQYIARHKRFKFTSERFGTYKELYLINHVPNGYLIRKSIFDKIGYYTPDAPIEDHWLMLQISKYAKMKYIDDILFSYRWHSTNTMKNKEKMRAMVEKTRTYEEKILASINENEVLPDVLEVIKFGALYRKQGIPYIFQILTYKKYNKKIKIIKLFNIKILTIQMKNN